MRALLAVALSGCSGLFGLDDPTLVGDATVGGDDVAGKELCLGEGAYRVCAPLPTSPLTLSGAVSTDSMCTVVVTSNGQQLCVITGTTIRVAGDPATGYGKRPLVLFASDEIAIDGYLDVQSRITGTTSGAGASEAPCSAVGTGTTSVNGSGGGAGGSFGALGGQGGGGDHGVSGGALAAIPEAPQFLRAGCGGSSGGGSQVSIAGSGGGAVLLLAAIKLTIAGTINASGGGGGRGVPSKGGGGGGGSGGMIALWSPTIELTGSIYANGGGGGGGADNAAAGDDGREAIRFDAAAAGGFGGGVGPCGNGPGCGGPGGWRDGVAAAGAADQTGAGGGGGGGSVGVILVVSHQTLVGMASPDPQPLQ